MMILLDECFLLVPISHPVDEVKVIAKVTSKTKREMNIN